MRKFLLVTLIGMVLAMNLYGIITKVISEYKATQTQQNYKGYTVVYME